MALQMLLNESRPFSRNFHGASDVSPEDRSISYYQHGLYFGPDKKLLVDHPYNRDKIAMLKKLGINPDEPKVEQELIKDPMANANPEVIAELEAKSDEEIFAMANKVVEFLKSEGQKVDYEPVAENRDDNVRFIAKHAG